jgi:hypothetical protein
VARPPSEIIDARGRLAFVAANGKEVLSGGVAFVAKEL